MTFKIVAATYFGEEYLCCTESSMLGEDVFKVDTKGNFTLGSSYRSEEYAFCTDLESGFQRYIFPYITYPEWEILSFVSTHCPFSILKNLYERFPELIKENITFDTALETRDIEKIRLVLDLGFDVKAWKDSYWAKVSGIEYLKNSGIDV